MRKGLDLDGRGSKEEKGEVEGEETKIRIHYGRKKKVYFQKRRNVKKEKNSCKLK